MPDKVLLCCFDFPPNEGIGGRRWAKLAKGLAHSGVHVVVVKADPLNPGDASPWQSDADHPKIEVHSIPRNYPKAISANRGGPIGSLEYRLAMRKLRRMERGTIFDIAVGWEPAFRQTANALLDKHRIKHVLATGAPFNVLYYIAKLKAERQDFHLICDYRDPWLNAKNYGMDGLSSERMAVEQEKQRIVFEQADVITTPNAFMSEEVLQTSPVPPAGRLTELPHFFDPDDVGAFLGEPQTASKGFRLVYGGALYLGLGPTLEDLVRSVRELGELAPELAEELRIDIYSPHFKDWPVLEQLGATSNLHPSIGKAFFGELRQSDGAIIMLAEHNRQFTTTKFFEYQPFAKPVAYFGPEGHVAESIVQNGLGHWIRNGEQLKAFMEAARSLDYKPAFAAAAEGSSLEARTNALLEMMH